MSGRVRGDFVAISLGSQSLPYDNAKTRAPTQSWFRFWYRMNGAQKICLFLVLGSLCVTGYSAMYGNGEDADALAEARDALPADLQEIPQNQPSEHHDAHREQRESDEYSNQAVKKRLDEVLERLRAENSNMQDLLKRAQDSKLDLANTHDQRIPSRVDHSRDEALQHENPPVQHHQKQQEQQQVQHEIAQEHHDPVPPRHMQGADAVHSEQQAEHVEREPERALHPAPAHGGWQPPAPGQPFHFPTGEETKVYGPKNGRQEAVVSAYKHAWKGYREHAWGHDELLPISKSYSEWFHLGLTLIDGLDTMYLMGLREEFEDAKRWVAHDMRLDQDVDVNLFECTIRVLGGLLSTYALSGDKVFLDKAKELGDRLYPAFNPNSGVPYSDVNLHTHQAHKPRWGPDSSTSEVSTIQLEFKYLSYLTGDKKYAERVSEIMRHLDALPKNDGLVPIFVNANSGQFSGNTITLGARGDSYYEYLLKQYIQTSKTEPLYSRMWLESVNGIRRHLVKKTPSEQLTYIAELINNGMSPKMDHLVCFMPGALALSYAHGFEYDHLELAKELMKTCNEMYVRMPTGLAPEIVHFHEYTSGGEDMYVKPADEHNLLRPETVESLFLLYRITKDPVYQEWGWKIFQAFEKHTKVPEGGYSSLHSVKHIPPSFRDKMESFFLGETLKYFFLLFGEDVHVLPLDKWVFNTEAHPLPILPHAV